MIKTWLPLPSFKDSVQHLNHNHLSLQRLHVLHIIEVIHVAETSDLPDNYDRTDDPTAAVKMWDGYEMQLLEYGLEACDEWSSRRGKKDPLYETLAQHLDWATSDVSNMGKPPWFGDVDFHYSHQAALVREDPSYARYFKIDTDRELIWPVSGYDG